MEQWVKFGDPLKFHQKVDTHETRATTEVTPGTEPTERSCIYFQVWREDEPNGKTAAEDCVHIDHDGQWNDNDCEFRFNFVCSMPSTSLEKWTCS